MQNLEGKLQNLEDVNAGVLKYLGAIKESIGKIVDTLGVVDKRLEKLETKINIIEQTLTKIDNKDIPSVKGDLSSIMRSLEDIDLVTGFKGMVSNIPQSKAQA